MSSTTKRPPVKVGDRLWYVRRRAYTWNQPHDCSEVVVRKVGRKWITIGDDLRIDIETWKSDGGRYGYPGRCYTSKEEYDTLIESDALWGVLRSQLRGTRPPNVTIEKIQQASELLGIDLKGGAE